MADQFMEDYKRDTVNGLIQENRRLRAALSRILEVLMPNDDARHIGTVGRAREIALAVLKDAEFQPIAAVSNGERSIC